MSLACKHALNERGVAHLVFPDEVQVLPEPEGAQPGKPAGRLADLAVSPPEGAVAQATRADRRRPSGRWSSSGTARAAASTRSSNSRNVSTRRSLTTFKAKGIVADSIIRSRAVSSVAAARRSRAGT